MRDRTRSGLLLLYFVCAMIMSVENTDLKILKRRIEEERQTTRIKTEIMRRLNISRPTGPTMVNARPGQRTDQQSYTDTKTTISDAGYQEKKHVIILGEPTSSKKDGCLNFPIRTYNIKDHKGIRPVRVNLWVHVRKRNKKGKKGNKSRGRRIRISVTNGTNIISRLRMRVTATDWQKIELPLSHFPDEVRLDNTFKLCLKCRKCNKRYKIDLYRKRKSKKNSKRSKNPTVPFISMEVRPVLPLRTNGNSRSQRSLDAVLGHVQETGKQKKSFTHSFFKGKTVMSEAAPKCRDSCCRVYSWIIESSAISPKILSPRTLKLNYCFNECQTSLEQRMKDNVGLSSTPYVDDHGKGDLSVCLPSRFRPINLVLQSQNNSSLTNTFVLEDLAIDTCKCRTLN